MLVCVSEREREREEEEEKEEERERESVFVFKRLFLNEGKKRGKFLSLPISAKGSFVMFLESKFAEKTTK